MNSSTKVAYALRGQMKFQKVRMSNSKSFGYDSFKLINTGKDVSGIDYLHAVYKSYGLDADFVLYIANLFWPKFKAIDNIIFIEELFDTMRYHDFITDELNAKEIQYWINLLEITGLFDDLSTNQAKVVADAIAGNAVANSMGRRVSRGQR